VDTPARAGRAGLHESAVTRCALAEAAEHFSYLMTTTLHADPDGSPFEERVQRARLHPLDDRRPH
jgi:hypothetical protein